MHKAFLQATRSDCIRLFDVNLRQAYFSSELIQASLTICNTLKVNEDELAMVAEMFEIQSGGIEAAHELMDRFDLTLIAVTLGAQGAALITKQQQSHLPAPRANVIDTVGAGDAFAAALVDGLLKELELDELNYRAQRIAAFVCGQPGATPRLPKDLID